MFPQGAGNIVRTTGVELEKKRQEEMRKQRIAARPPPVDHDRIDYRGWADRGKQFLLRRVSKRIRT